MMFLFPRWDMDLFPPEYVTPLKLSTSATYMENSPHWTLKKKTKETSAASQGELSAEKLFDNTANGRPPPPKKKKKKNCCCFNRSKVFASLKPHGWNRGDIEKCYTLDPKMME